MKEPVRWSA